MKVLNVEPARYDAALRGKLGARAEVAWEECRDQQDFVRLAGASPWAALFVRLGVAVDAAVVACTPALRWVVTPTTGTDHLDLPLLAKKGVRVISLKGETDLLSLVTSTAEHTWAILLCLLRKVTAAQDDVLAGNWRREPFLGRELAGMVLGVVGYGRLGRMVANYGCAFGMRVLINDVSEAALVGAPGQVEKVTIDALLAQSDVVSLHVPLDPSTHGLLSRARVERMKPAAVLVNTARGEVLDDVAVLDALESGALSGAAVDVLADDSRWGPRLATDATTARWLKLAGEGRVVVTPHIGGYGASALRRTREFVVDTFLEQSGAAAGKE